MDVLRPRRFALLVTLSIASAGLASTPIFSQVAPSSDAARGQYLVRVGDCAYCHTDSNGKSFAGGRAIPTPFGVIYSTNITPDPTTGIGAWTEQDFYKAMHTGIRRDGSHLYPAFPYPWFTRVSRADVDAIKTYLDTIEPVEQANRSNALPWPLSWRGALLGWNALYFDKGDYKTDTTESAQWNRGAYLVQGLAHCGACHTPDTWLGGTKRREPFEGGNAGLHWSAPSLGNNIRDGIGHWSTAEIVEYLKTGANANAKSASAGPMTDVVMNSTQYLSDADLNSIALYLKNRPNDQAKSTPKAGAFGLDAQARGEALYLDNCTACHMSDGRGIPKVFPPLAGSSAIQADSPGTVIHVVLAGAKMASPPSKPTGLAMPGFDWKLDDHQVADVVNYIRHAWGNRAPLVDAKAVAAVRKDIQSADRPSRAKAMSPTETPRRANP